MSCIKKKHFRFQRIPKYHKRITLLTQACTSGKPVKFSMREQLMKFFIGLLAQLYKEFVKRNASDFVNCCSNKSRCVIQTAIKIACILCRWWIIQCLFNTFGIVLFYMCHESIHSSSPSTELLQLQLSLYL